MPWSAAGALTCHGASRKRRRIQSLLTVALMAMTVAGCVRCPNGEIWDTILAEMPAEYEHYRHRYDRIAASVQRLRELPHELMQRRLTEEEFTLLLERNGFQCSARNSFLDVPSLGLPPDRYRVVVCQVPLFPGCPAHTTWRAWEPPATTQEKFQIQGYWLPGEESSALVLCNR